jgi:hypothetical protein
MQMIYVDDSGDSDVAIFSAVSVPAGKWHEAYSMLLDVVAPCARPMASAFGGSLPRGRRTDDETLER